MSVLTKTVGAQWVLAAEFEANFDDTMVNTSGNSAAFSAIDGTATFDVITPPPGAVVNGGSVHVITAFDSTTNTLDVGDSDDPDRYTAAVLDMKAAVTKALSPAATAKVYDGSQAIRLSFAGTGAAATAGKFRIVVEMTVGSKVNENLKTT